jgi:hypothetical protein
VHFGTIELGGHTIAKHLRHLSNKARILDTTQAKLIVKFIHGIFKQTIW